MSSNKSKIIINISEPKPPTKLKMNGQVLEEVDKFKYLYLGSPQNMKGTSMSNKKAQQMVGLCETLYANNRNATLSRLLRLFYFVILWNHGIIINLLA